jgi:hypothetical protein
MRYAVAMNVAGSPAVNVNFDDTQEVVKRVLEIEAPKRQKGFLVRVLSQAAKFNQPELIDAFFQIMEGPVLYSFQVPIEEAFKTAVVSGHVEVSLAIMHHDHQQAGDNLLLPTDYEEAMFAALLESSATAVEAILNAMKPSRALTLVQALMKRKTELPAVQALYIEGKQLILEIRAASAQ